ncbi:ankyrin-2b isoform X3 [Ictalurus punctatus]|uniref:Ankyrin-2b isoform X3 n=1 Tax=Ictalurus punctatus TaxID=7998 RepID=A0A9F7RL15_ICTPU|nr:ankyrin-2b isoform X3 [Ictalurus punctatus]
MEIPIPKAEAKSVCELPSNQRPSDEYMKHHVEEISDKFYRALFGEDHVMAKTLGKDITKVTESFESSEHQGISVNKVDAAEALNVDQVVSVSSETTNTNISTKELQNIKTVCSSLPKQLLPWHEGEIAASNIDSILIKMSPDSATGQTNSLSSPIMDESESLKFSTEFEVHIPKSKLRATNSQDETKYSSVLSKSFSDYRPFMQDYLMYPSDCRSSPVSVSEYEVDLEISLHEYSSLSPESTVLLPPDSPIPFDYRSGSLDSCMLIDDLRACSPESVTSGTEQKLLSPDSPIPDFRPHSPILPVCEYAAPEFTMLVDIHRISDDSDQLFSFDMHESNTQFCPQRAFLMVADEIDRPISPGSWTECGSLTPESNESFSVGSFTTERLDRELSTETPLDSEHGPWTSDIFLDRSSGPGSAISLNEYRSLTCDSPILSFTPEVSEYFTQVKGSISSSPQSEMSDLGYELSSEWLFDGQPSSPESAASVNERKCLSPDSPLPSFVQNVYEFMPIKECRSVSPKSDLSDQECKLISEECRPLSPDSFSCVNEHIPLSPDSTIPSFSVPVCELYASLGYQSESLASDLSDREHKLISATGILFENRSSSPDSVSSLNVLGPLSPDLILPEYKKKGTDCDFSLHIHEIASFQTELSNVLTSYEAEPKSLQSHCFRQQSPEFLETDNCLNKYALEGLLLPDSTKHLSKQTSQMESKNATQEKGNAQLHEEVETTLTHRLSSPKVGKSSMLLKGADAQPLTTDLCDSVSNDEPKIIGLPEARCSVTGQIQNPFNIETILTKESEVAATKRKVQNLMSKVHDPQYKGKTFCPNTTVFEYSVTVEENRPLSPVSTICQFRPFFTESGLPVSVYRSCSPESICSKSIENESFAGDLFDVKQRSESLDSFQSKADARPLNPDSIPEYRPMSTESRILDSDIRGSSPDSVSSCRPLSPDSPIPQYSGLFCELMPVRGHRPSSPESLAPDIDYDEDDEYELNAVTETLSGASSLDSMKSADENRPLSPDSPIQQFRPFFPESSLPVSGYRSCSPESVCSSSVEHGSFPGDLFIIGERLVSPESMILASDIRGSSPDSVRACRPLSPDSPIPQYSGLFCELIPVRGHRPSSPESLAPDIGYDEDDEYELNAVSETFSRTSSPDSMKSADENRPLSPDSPIQQFRPFFPESHLPVSGYRSCSPESVCSSSVEHGSFPGDLFIIGERLVSPESMILASDIRGSSPDSVSACRPLSPDSPIPQYSGLFCELIPVRGHRPSSPESLAPDIGYDEDDEYELNAVSETFSRTSSPDSMKSADENSPLSPDSPIQQFRPFFPESSLPISGYRSCSPESVCSSSVEHGSFPGDLFIIGERLVSPESMILASDNRGSSPDSVSACRPLSPDSPIPQYSGLFCELIPVRGHRPSSPESLAPDIGYDEDDEYELNAVTETLSRASSLDSMKSADENRPLSPDSPIQQFRPFYPESSLPISGYRSCSPESVCSNSIEHESSPGDLFIVEQRPGSPDSVQTEFEARALSPDSIPEYRPMSPESMILASDIRGSSPDSFSACSPLSPDSPIPQYSGLFCELMPVRRHRPSFPESLASDKNYVEDDDYALNAVSETLSRASSPDSLKSADENRPLSPDSPILQFRPFFPESHLPVSGYRSCSPESVCSSSAEHGSFPGDLFIIGERLVSPESMILASDIRGSSPDSVSACRSLSPDSPIPQYSGLFCELIPVRGHRPSSPESLAPDIGYDEDDEYELNAVTETFSRTSSPDSMKSADENSPLSPDSPIQQFRPFFPESHLPVSGYRSCSPESVCSSSVEHGSFPGDLFIIGERLVSPESMILASDIRGSSPDSVSACRPLSPDSPIPQYSGLFCELIPVRGHRPSSPESLAPDIGYDEDDEYELNAVTETLSRASSLDSMKSADENRPLSPDSPIQQFRPFYPESSLPISGYRSCSPESVCSNSIEHESSPGDLFIVEQRPGSPDSVQTEFEARALSPDSIPEYRPMSPESMILASDIRGSSPDSFSACSPLSPDSPIPQYSGLFCELMPVRRHRPSSPESLASDIGYDEDDEYELNAVTETFSRTSSPDSMKSADENSPLSPDSPIQQFRPFFPESHLPVSGYRSCSPESVCSSSVEHGSFPGDLFIIGERLVSPESMILASDIRGSSPDSVSACRPLSPDSPIPQYSGLFCELIPVRGHRPSSPESLAPDIGYDEDDEYELNAVTETLSRASSLDSMKSADENRPLSPDSPIQQFRPFYPESSLPISGYRSCSPESVCSNSIEHESSPGDLFIVEQRPGSPDSVQTEFEARALSPDSIPEYRPMSPESMILASDIRGSSPDSFSACSPLSPDSPIPQYSGLFCELMPVRRHRPSSPESLASDKNYDEDDDYALNAVSETLSRASSPDSLKSADENRPLSPDSPILQFRPFFPESHLPVSGYRSCSPESVCSSSAEHGSFPGDLFIIGERLVSPESMILASDIRGSSPDSVSACRSLSPDSPIPQYSGLFCELIPVRGHRPSSPESLAPDIGYDEDDEYELNAVTETFSRTSSPDSMKSADENSPLSPDSPIQQFRPFFPESHLPVSGYRSCSPESVCSSSVEHGSFPGDLFIIGERLVSPESMILASDIRGSSPDSVSACRPLSPDSPIPQYSGLFCELIPVRGHRPSSPESLAPDIGYDEDDEYELNAVTETLSRASSLDSMKSADENRPLSPDSPIQQFRPFYPESSLPISGYRSCSPESVCSNSIEHESSPGDLFIVEQRPGSPDSVQTEFEARALSPDSIPEYRPMSPESMILASDIRGSSPDSFSACSPLSPDSPIPQYSGLFCELMPVRRHRPSSPESLASDKNYDEDDDYALNAVSETLSRASSPDSLKSADENRPLSPDSPILQFRPFFPESHLPVSGYRSCSPESVCSSSAEHGSFPGDLFIIGERLVSPESMILASDIRGSSPDSVSACRSLSPDSPIPQYSGLFCELIPVRGHRPSSPESLAPDIGYDEDDEYELNAVTETFSRTSSPDSMKSADENCPLSPDSPIQQFRPFFPESHLPVSGYRSCSPESVCSSSVEHGSFPGDLFIIGERLVSPESMILASDIRGSSPDSVSACRPLSPDSPIPQYSGLFCELIPVRGHRPSSPESLAPDIGYDEDDEYELNAVTETLSRASSLDSMKSADENRPLSPDSPIQQFRPFYPESSLPISGYRSCSPESVCSNSIEHESSPGDLFIVEQRPGSPDSVQTEFEARALSPDSIPEYRPMSPESMILASDITGSSPDSFSAFSPLSPDSPIPQYSGLFCELMPVRRHRPSSPESLASDKNYDEDDDYALNAVSETLSRASSPDSLKSADENRPLSPDSPTLQFRPFFPESHLPVSGYRSCSPESVCSSSVEHGSFPGDLFIIGERLVSPESMILASDIRGSSPDSVSACRPLSPDSPIPQYSGLFCELIPVRGHRPSSPESLAPVIGYDEDDEYELNAVTETLSRASSLDSMKSADENRPLSPDSPIQQFRPFYPESSLPISGYRSCSPESVYSNSIEHESSPGDLFIVEQRPGSPDSVQTEFEARALSPDSIPEYRPMSPESMILASDIRGSSPDSFSACSPLSPDSPIPQYSGLFCELMPVRRHRPSSPESLAPDIGYDEDDEYELNAVTETFSRTSSPDSMKSADENSPLSPDSPIQQFRPFFPESHLPVSGYRSCSPESVCSSSVEHGSFPGDLFIIGERLVSPESMILASDIRGSSPDSVSACRPLSPDSPIPQYSGLFCELIPVRGHRPSSPESLAPDIGYDEDDEYELNAVTETLSRASSLDSMKSADENRPLSPDSPIQQFRPFYPESSLPISGYRSCSPESVCSNSIEHESSPGDLFIVEQRPGSPDSVQTEFEARALSPDSIPEYRPMSPESMILASDIRGSSPDSFSACSPLSPDSPIPQYSGLFCELMPVRRHRPSSPESLASDKNYDEDDDYALNAVSETLSRASSPDSLKSADENRPLSPDSPILQFRPFFPESHLPVSGYRSCSPESVCSSSAEHGSFPGDLFIIGERLVSPESMILASDIRGSSPDSVSACRSLSPDSPIPQYSGLFCELIPVRGHRPSSPESLAPDIGYDEDDEYELNAVTETFSRTSSPDSMKSADENSPLSPDSPIQQFRPFFPESHLPVSGYRSCSPESVCSSSVEHGSFPGDLFIIGERLVSPESMILASDIRGSSPDSVSACRPLSPDSPIPQYSGLFCELIPVRGHRPSSPESLAPDIGYDEDDEYDLNAVTETLSRASSLDSMKSADENRPLSPDSPVQQFRPFYPESSLPISGYRSCSPEPVCSNSIEHESSPGDLFIVEQRPGSPDSVQTEFEARALSPDSIPEYRPMSPESMILASDITGSSPDSFSAFSPLSPDSPIPQYSGLFCELMPVRRHRPSSPESLASDKNYDEDDDYALNAVSETLSRASSPDSMKSADENSPLSPDSPTLQFRPFFLESHLPVSGYRSCSPESVCSSSVEHGSFPGDLFIVSERPESPDSVQSEFEARSLSPDSLPEYRPMSPESMILASDIRGSSPDSVSTCRPLSPDSPIPQYSTMLVDLVSVTGHRSSSPESLPSDEDYEFNVFSASPSNYRPYRPDSPDSVISANENRPPLPDSPIPEFQTSVSSETIECKGFEGDIFTAEQRRESFDSSGPMSYPQFQETIKMLPEYKLVYKTIPLNLIAHIHDPHYKGEMFSPKTGVFEYTGCRMEIVQTSKMDESNGIIDQDTYKIPALTHEPSQILMQTHKILTIPLSENQTAFSALSLTQSRKYNRESFEFPEENSADSISWYISEGREYLELSDDCRASSPESIRSVNEFRPLTPDSPIPEHMTLLPYTMLFQYESRPPSPESVSSVNEFRRLSPDSPIPEFLASSPVPYEHNVQFRQLSETNLIHISPVMCDLQEFDVTWTSSEYGSLWRPETEQRPVSPGYELSECDSKSLSSPTFSFESTCRCPSPEALREIEPTVSLIADSLIFDADCRPESPESVTSQTQCKDSMPDNKSHWESDVALLPVMINEQYRPETEMISESDLAKSAQSQGNFNYVLNSCSRTLPCWHEFVLEPEQEEKISETREAPPPVMNKVKKMSAGDGDGRSILSIQGDHQGIKIVKQELELQHKHCPEERSDSPTSEKGQPELKTRALQDKDSEKDIQLKKQNIEIKNKNTSVSEEDSSQFQNQGDIVTILEQKANVSSLTSEGNIQQGICHPKSLHYIPEGRTVVSNDLENVRPMISLNQSLEHPKETSGLCRICTTPFHFNHQQSHRTVTPNVSISGYPSSDCRDVMSRSVRTPFLGSRMLPTDLGSVTPVSSELCSNQELSTNSQFSIEKECFESFHHVISEFEKTVSPLSTDDPKLVSSEIWSMETALAPTSSEISQSKNERLMDVDLKSKPRPVQADSLDSDTEFFDCQQTFSDASEPELKSEELFDSETVYHVEESLSLPNTPAYDYLSATPKITEKSELDSEDSPRPVSWGSEEIDLPIVLEPEDESESVGEHDEDIAYPYGYAGEHSYAEELPPRQGGQYDEDDDSLGREIAEELGLLSDSSEEEVLTTRVVRRRVIIQGDDFPEISPHTVTEEQYTDEHGNIVTKKITRKIIRKYVSADGVEREEVMVEGAQQEAITVDDADGFSKVVKRTVVRSAGDQTEDPHA